MRVVAAARPDCQTAPTALCGFVYYTVFAAVLVFGRHDSMYWYPVLVNLMMLAVFGGSLFAGQTVIEKLARLQQPDLPEKLCAIPAG